MNVLELLNQGSKHLKQKKITSHRLDSEILLSKDLDKRREDVLINLDQKIYSNQIFRYNKLLNRRSQNEPVAYILQEKEFWSKNFFVNNNTLIPRPETELMVEKLVKIFKDKRISILDIGTGSGCILISLLSELKNSKGVGIDISKNAVLIAKKNAKRHKMQHNTNFFNKSLEVVIGANVAAKLKLEIGDSFNGSHGIEESTHDHEDFPYRVVGILSPTGEVIDQLIITSLESVWQVHPHNDKKGSFDLKTAEEHDHHSHDHKTEVSENNREVTAVLVNYNSPRAKFSIPGIVNQKNALMGAEPAIEIKQLLDLIEPAVNVIYVLSLFIFGLSLFSIVVTLLNSMKDRKYEISMMRVGGASVRLIFISIILEGFFIGLLGSVSGLILGHSIMGIMARFLNLNYNYQFSGLVFDGLELVLLFVTILIGVIAAIFPAIAAYRLDISKTLKNKI